MKPQTANSVVVSVRCAHRSTGGRRCRLSVSDPRSVFCPQHRSEHLEEEAADHFSYLSHNFQYFQTAQGINHSLGNLYQLLAENRISPRRAAVLSHICGLLLRTLPQIDADRAAAITTIPTDDPAQIQHADSGEHIEEDAEEQDDSVLDLVSDSGTDTEMQTGIEMEAHAGSTNTWDPSISEPDPRKKPS